MANPNKWAKPKIFTRRVSTTVVAETGAVLDRLAEVSGCSDSAAARAALDVGASLALRQAQGRARSRAKRKTA